MTTKRPLLRADGRYWTPLAAVIETLCQDPPLAAAALLAGLVPLLPPLTDDPQWHGLRSGAVEAGAGLILALRLGLPGPPIRGREWAAAVRGLRLLFAFMGWAVLSAIGALGGAPLPSLAQGLLLPGAGLVLAASVAAGVRDGPRFRLIQTALTGAALLAGLSGLALRAHGAVPMAVGLAGDHQLFAAPFVLLLPLALAAGLTPGTPSRRLSAWAALAVGLTALALAEARAAWIGTAVAALVFTGLRLWEWSSGRTGAPRAHGGPPRGGWDTRDRAFAVTMALLALAGMLVAGPQAASVAGRLRTLTTTVAHGEEWSVNWRLAAWRGARRMILIRPVLGWGPGCYPVFQNAFTGVGQGGRLIRAHGPVIEDLAHDSYLQAAAETGLPGLGLWLGGLGMAAWSGASAWRRMVPGGRRTTLAACLSALAGYAVDAAADPAWQFGDASLFLWLTLGLTVALSQGVAIPGGAARPRVVLRGRGRVLAAAAVGAAILWLVLATMPSLPAPKLG